MKKRIISLLLCLCMVFSLLPTAVLAADGENPDASAGPGQVMQQNPENPDNQAGQNDLKNSENSDDLKNSEDSDDLKNSENSDDLKNSENSDDLNDSENQDDLNDPENPDDSDAPQPLGEGLGSELSGNCGATEADHVTWELTDDDGDGSYTLTISGNGAMKDYTSQAGETVADPTGWYALKDSISEIKIEEGVTYLGNWAFSYLTNVVKVNIPATITSLGDHIFRGDTALTTVEWASGFNAPVITDTDSKDDTYTGNYVPTSMFDGCTSLGSGEELSAWLPASFTGVGCAAFRGTQFTVDFGDWSNLTYIGAYGFAGMPNLDSFTLSNEIRLGLRGGASNAFNSSGLKSLTVADGISEIPSGLCNGCEQLSSVALADFVTTIATNAFFNTKALKEIDLKNVQTINSYAFWGSGLTALVLPKSVKTVENRAFEACTSLMKVTIKAAELTLENRNTFAGCSSLSTVVTSADSKINLLNASAFGPDTTVYAQAPVESIEINGTVDTLNFSTLSSLKSLTINGKNTWYGNILPSGFENLVINGDNWNINGYQFAGKTPIKHLIVSTDEFSTDKQVAAFRSNPNLETAQFTGKTVKLQAKMFLGCTKLKWLDLSAVDTLTVGSGCFGDDDHKDYEVVPGEPNKFNEDCVIYAKDAAAAQTLRGSGSGLDKKGIVLIVNGGTVDVTAATAGFGAVSWEGFTAKWYDNKDFAGRPVTGEPETGKTYYVQWTKGVFRGSCGATGNEDNVDWTLAYEGNDEFTLSITGRGAMADYTCNITGSDATQPWRESMTGVKPTAITRVVVGNGVTNIGEFACDGLSQVKEYNIAASVEDIGAWGVCGQNATTYNLNGSTHYVTKDGVLMSADGKTLVSYPGGKGAVDEYVIPNTVETILPGAFVGSDAKKVVIPSSVTNFPRFSFGGSTVEEIEFNATVTTLEGGAFSGLSKLKSLVFGGTKLTTIEGQACSDLSSLTEITFPDSLTTIGDQAFKVLPSDGAAAPNLKKVTFGKGMSTIGDVVFLRQSALEVIDMTHCAKTTLEAVGMFNSRDFDGNETHPYTNTPIVYTADEGVAGLVKQNNRNLIYAVTNGGTFPADTVFEAGELASPKKEGCLFLGWYEDPAYNGEKVTAGEAGKIYYAKWMGNIPEPTDADFTDGLVTVKCLSPVPHTDVRYGPNAAVAAKKYTKKQLSATEYSVTYEADAFAVHGHSLYSADKLNWKLTYDGSKWNLEPQERGVDDVVLVTHAPTTFDEVTKFIDGRTDVIKTSCVNGETATCAYGLMVAFMNPDHVVSVEQEKDSSSGEPIRGSYIATLQVDQFAEACAKACNSKSFADSPRAHDVRSQNPVQWRFKVTQAEVSTDTSTEKQYVWSAEPVEEDTDDVCQVAHRVVLTFQNGDETSQVEYKYNTTEITNNVEVPTPTREGYTFIRWLDADGNAFDPTANVTEDHTYNNIEWKPIKYRVIFDANAGDKTVTGTMGDQVFTYDQKQTLNANQFVCTDSVFDNRLKKDTQLYEFGGWNTEADGSGTLYADEADFTNKSVKHGERITLYAQWKHVTKTLTYHDEVLGVNASSDVDIFSKVIVNEAPTGYDTTKYIFKGWRSNVDGLREVFQAGDEFIMPNTDVTLTAVWEEIVPTAKANLTYVDTVSDGAADAVETEAGTWVTVKAAPAAMDGKTFKGWKSNIGGTVYQPGDKFQMPATDVTLTAVWDSETYTITWKNGDTILDKTNVKRGETPEYIGETPTKEATAEYTYTFSGWTPEPAAATADTTYEANFTQAKRSYTVKFYNADGTLLESKQVEYGTVPKLGRTPTLEGNSQYSYTFKTWSPKLAPVTGDAEYTAVYDRTENTYTVTWVIEGVSTTETYTYNEMPAYKGDTPAKADTSDAVYEFTGWLPALSLVTRDVTYTAQFRTIGKYTVSYDLAGGESAKPDDAKYAEGEAVNTPATVPTKTGYVFTGWLVSFENKTVNANGSFTMPNTDVTLTAQWRVAITGKVYIPAMNPEHGTHEEPYSAQLTAKKDNAYGDPVAAGDVQFVLVDANGHADTSRNIGHGLTLNADGSITGTANGAGEVTFRVRLANAAGDFVSDSFEFTIVIDKATRKCTVTMEGWTYGDEPNKPVVTLPKTEGTESYTYFYKVKDAAESTYTMEVPVNAGDYTVKVVVAESANYKSCEGTADFTIHKALITSVDPVVTAPVACEAAQSTIANGNGYTGTITWNPADATFQYSTVYTATVVLTPDSNHKFDNTTTATNGWALEFNENGTLTLTKVFPRTAQDTVKTPVIRPNGGRFYGSETITITCPTDGADIYYTLDGTTPTTGSKQYTGAFKIKESTTVKAIAVKANYIDSAVATAEFTKRTGGNGGGGSGMVVTPVKPSKKDDSLKFNTEDHFAYVNGYPDGTVKPTGDVTRAEVAAILYRVMDADCVKTYETTRCSFSDVVRGDWFNLYVATLENADVIVDTRTNGKFRPNEAITRAELAAMLAQFADIKSAANSFNDVSARHWASDEIAVCAKMGWINGYPDGSFRPDATITRAEMMAMINRALGRTPKSADDLLSGMKTWRDNANVNAWYYLDVQEATNSHTYTKSGSHETWKKLR